MYKLRFKETLFLLLLLLSSYYESIANTKDLSVSMAGIDGGIEWLILAGLLLGTKKLYKIKKIR